MPGWVVLAWCGATAISLPAQTFTVLYNECSQVGCVDGRHPSPSLIQGADGNLYGGGFSGGLNQSGTVFKITPTGQLTTLYQFCAEKGCADGVNPYGYFVLGIDGNYYGATWWGGITNAGVLFKMTPAGQVTTVHTFCIQAGCPDGEYPWGNLVQDYLGNIYGTASAGGAHGSFGTVFQLPPTGGLKTLHSFCSLSDCSDGDFPIQTLVLGSNGTIYGAAQSGGAYGKGTVFKLTQTGTLTTLHHFCAQSGCPDGSTPSTLVLGSDGNFYGTTREGGSMNAGVFFKVAPSGQLVTLYNFCSRAGCADGGGPFSLMQATDGNFYGITQRGDGAGSGTVFKLTPSGSLTVLHTFCSGGACTDGKLPSTGGLVQHTNGIFYGVIGHGGNLTSNGTIFSLSTGLAPFVLASPAAAPSGTAIRILGTNLTGATSVTFNGTAATFKLVSSTEITTNVPAGATTGLIRVVLPASTLSSNVAFAVLP